VAHGRGAQGLIAGVDGCRGGWLAVIKQGRELRALIAPDFAALLGALPGALIGIDIPIGFPDRGARSCDVLARELLGRPRASSVFPAPVRACLKDWEYRRLCSLHREIDGRGLGRQTFNLLPKIRQVDAVLVRNPQVARRIREVHPEVSFALWNGTPMMFNKATPEGRRERERLIDREWPGERERLARELRGNRFAADDLNDAFAVLWSARRIAGGRARVFPEEVQRDAAGLRMRIEG
jgi:predicted RNase H-like nuclease